MDNILDLLTKKILDLTYHRYAVGDRRINKLYLTPEGFEIINTAFKAKIEEHSFLKWLDNTRKTIEDIDVGKEEFNIVYINGLEFRIEKADIPKNTLLISNFENYIKEEGENILSEDIYLREDFPLSIILNMKKL